MKKLPNLLSEKKFQLLRTIILDECGISFDRDRNNSLSFAVNERCDALSLKTHKEYYQFLKYNLGGTEEIQNLIEQVTVGETYFFRNKPQLDVLVKYVLPEIVQKKIESGDKTLRIWSAGCSKGDEAYSISISLIETLPSYEEWQISILGTDINRAILKLAKKGIYNHKDISRTPKFLVDKYFTKANKNYFLKSKVKKNVKFAYHNLSKLNNAFEDTEKLDIIFCRNVTIYFDLNTTKKLINMFYESLNWDSYLFLGHAETLWHINDKFKTVEFDKTFIYKKEVLSEKNNIELPKIELQKIILEDFVPLIPALKKEKVLPDSKAFTPPVVQSVVDTANSEPKTEISSILTKALDRAGREEYRESEKLLLQIIKIDNLCLEAYYYLAVLYLKMENKPEAEAYFRKVIYIRYDVVLAHFYLGKLCLSGNRLNDAGREFSNAIKILEKMNDDDCVRFGDGFKVGILLKACKKNLKELIVKKH